MIEFPFATCGDCLHFELDTKSTFWQKGACQNNACVVEETQSDFTPALAHSQLDQPDEQVCPHDLKEESCFKARLLFRDSTILSTLRELEVAKLLEDFPGIDSKK